MRLIDADKLVNSINRCKLGGVPYWLECYLREAETLVNIEEQNCRNCIFGKRYYINDNIYICTRNETDLHGGTFLMSPSDFCTRWVAKEKEK